MSFSDNLKTIRKEKNLSQEELAELLGVSRQAVSKWKSGDGYPEVEKLLMIAGKLNVSLDNLMGTEIVITDENKNNAPGQDSPKYALFAQDQNEHSFWGATSTFLGWYMTEESVMKEMEEIRQALFCGSDMYELKYSVKNRKTFLSVKAV